MVKMTVYVNGNFEMLEACAEMAAYADSSDLFVDKLVITCDSIDNWTITAEMLPFKSQYIGNVDDIPF